MTKSENSRNSDTPPTPAARPHLTPDAEKIGGRVKVEIEDFEVDEIPAYEPDGEGPHCYLRVEKRNVDGRSLIATLAQHFGVSKADIGTAGTKDRRAITRQWVSLPMEAFEDDALPECGTIEEGIKVLKVSRHGNKLRTGHLKGNRFSLKIRDTDLSGEALEEAVRDIAGQIEAQGLPNYYGLQRFGDQGSTLQAGWKWLKGGSAPRGRFLRRMAASAVQSEIFNRVLAERLQTGTWKEVIDGDIFEKLDSGGRFWISESEREETQRRLDGREIVVTGPMPGSRDGLAEGQAGEIERGVMAKLGIEEEELTQFGRRARGTRRALTVFPIGLSCTVDTENSVQIEFQLRSGSYATVLLREFTG